MGAVLVLVWYPRFSAAVFCVKVCDGMGCTPAHAKVFLFVSATTSNQPPINNHPINNHPINNHPINNHQLTTTKYIHPYQ
jgi:hypothetical protein